MKFKVVKQWRPNNDKLCILYLSEAKTVTSSSDDYQFCRIDDVIYKPIPMSHVGGKCIAVREAGDFVGKTVEFIK